MVGLFSQYIIKRVQISRNTLPNTVEVTVMIMKKFK